MNPGSIRPPGGAPAARRLDRTRPRPSVPTDLAARAVAAPAATEAVRQAKPGSAGNPPTAKREPDPLPAAHACESGSRSASLRRRAYARQSDRATTRADARTNIWL